MTLTPVKISSSIFLFLDSSVVTLHHSQFFPLTVYPFTLPLINLLSSDWKPSPNRWLWVLLVGVASVFRTSVLCLEKWVFGAVWSLNLNYMYNRLICNLKTENTYKMILLQLLTFSEYYGGVYSDQNKWINNNLY